MLLASVPADAQYMNKGTGDLIFPGKPSKPIVTEPICPFCEEKFKNYEDMVKHASRCPYRYCIEYTYDAAGNRIRRAVVWTVAPEMSKKLNKAEKELNIENEMFTEVH